MTTSQQELWVGVDLGGTKMLATCFDGDFVEQGSQKNKTKGFEGQEAGVIRMINTIDEALTNSGRSRGEINGIGVACPGPIDLSHGILMEAANLGWQEVPLEGILSAEFKCPVEILNDVDAGVFGEYKFGVGQLARSVAGIFPGTGVGGGFVYDGKILRGKKQSCFEIGHIPLSSDGPLCGCGQRGCLETLCSRLTIASQAAQAAYRGQAPYLMEKTEAKLSKIRSGTLRDSIAAGDKAIEEIVRGAAGWLGMGIATIVNLMAPDIVVLGGGLVEAMPDIFLNESSRVAKGRVMPSYKDSFQVVTSRLGDLASVKGAAGWVKETSVNGAH